MFERFTDSARRVVTYALDEAHLLGHGYIGTEHLLLGLLRETDGLARRVLLTFELSLEPVRAKVAEAVARENGASTGQLPLTPLAQRALDLGLREANQLGHASIDTEHLLLGLLDERGEVVDEVLLMANVDAAALRVRLLAFAR